LVTFEVSDADFLFLVYYTCYLKLSSIFLCAW
jgi:hypothetical protein